MAKAYLEIFTEVGKERQVRDSLRKIEKVKSADLVSGRYDIIAIIEADTYDDIVKVILDEIRKIDGVQKTITRFAFE